MLFRVGLQNIRTEAQQQGRDHRDKNAAETAEAGKVSEAHRGMVLGYRSTLAEGTGKRNLRAKLLEGVEEDWVLAS